MGKIIEYVCPSCENSWQIQIGHGMTHGVLEKVLDEFSEKTQQQILTDTYGEEFPSFEFNYHPAVCRHCRKLFSIPSIYLHQSSCTYSSICPECGNAASIQTEEEIICPHCGEGILSKEEVGRWD